MSTLVIRDTHAPKVSSPLRGIARVASVAVMVLEVFAEAQHQAYQVKRRYPFMSW
jgi:hypothetical protein